MTTQIIYLNIAPKELLDDKTTPSGKLWAKSLDFIEGNIGFQRLYWGRRLEEPEKVQLHIVWQTIEKAKAFLSSSQYQTHILPIFNQLHKTIDDTQEEEGKHKIKIENIQIRHTTLHHQVLENPFGPSLLGSPIGTAVYKGTDAAWNEGAWPLWTHVVRHVDGCKGIAAGTILEPVEGLANSYLVYVGWETVKHHDDYHHTDHFRKHYVILNIGHQGYTEYGHVIFKEIREGKVETNKL